MRLLNIHTLEFRWFAEVPEDEPYMILSHVWEEDELTYEEHEVWLRARAVDADIAEPDKAGFRKLKDFCRVSQRDYHIVSTLVARRPAFDGDETTFTMVRRRDASDDLHNEVPDLFENGYRFQVRKPFRSQDLQWAWIDTCCIDKRSSSELSEAINSMYQWYANACCCIAYLSDVSSGRGQRGDTPLRHVERSKWFTRGWTLQELIAPRDVRFYDADWRPFWSRKIQAKDLAVITSVHEKILITSDMDELYKLPVSVRLWWAARRETTRVEDRAYSLLGLLDINMPLLYGEGEKAFARLQETFIKQTVDHSIITWDRRFSDGYHIYKDDARAGAKKLELFAHTLFPKMSLKSPLCKFSWPGASSRHKLI